ncbi:MAG: hypothetical protein IPI16_13110 [Comamonadaceae bacterium]|nr:hypothetical protein [Comamonadaceae bacterium]
MGAVVDDHAFALAARKQQLDAKRAEHRVAGRMLKASAAGWYCTAWTGCLPGGGGGE